MITVKQAITTILHSAENFGEEEVLLHKSVGRILKEDICADRDFPPFHRVSMDGIALQHQTFLTGKKTYQIEGIQAAGAEQIALSNPNNCVEAMTGAVLPKNTDVVVPYELISIENGCASLNIDAVNYFQNIHKKGKDRKKGALLVKKNTVISAAEIGILATVGKAEVMVAKPPKIAIISTGDELVEVHENPKEHQIRKSNVHTLWAVLQDLNIKNADTFHFNDDKTILLEKIEAILQNYDVLLFSGAVSKGKFDFLPEVLDQLEVKKQFHKVQQRPGKPFWFGKKENKTVFAFPGNPVSTFVSFLKYFIPWYKKSMGLPFENMAYAILAETVTFKPNLSYFLQVKLENKQGKIYAIPVYGNGSGDLANLAEADAFIELPSEKAEFLKGEVYPILRYRKHI